jgi:hypothetical protein
MFQAETLLGQSAQKPLILLQSRPREFLQLPSMVPTENCMAHLLILSSAFLISGAQQFNMAKLGVPTSKLCTTLRFNARGLATRYQYTFSG